MCLTWTGSLQHHIQFSPKVCGDIFILYLRERLKACGDAPVDKEGSGFHAENTDRNCGGIVIYLYRTRTKAFFATCTSRVAKDLNVARV